MATLNTLFYKASILLRLNSQENSPKLILQEGEVIYCKNNVCVHPPAALRSEIDHHPGYLCIKAQNDEVLGSTLILSWIPNSTLKKNPRSLEKRTPGSSPCRSSLSSTCPSPTLGSSVGGSIPPLPRSGSHSPLTNADKGLGQTGFFHRPSFSCIDHERRSISSTMSDLGSPRDDLQSLDSWTNSDLGTDMTASQTSQTSLQSHDLPEEKPSPFISALKDKNHSQSQTDSGIGPEEVTAALESMISGLNDIEAAAQCENSGNYALCIIHHKSELCQEELSLSSQNLLETQALQHNSQVLNSCSHEIKKTSSGVSEDVTWNNREFTNCDVTESTHCASGPCKSCSREHYDFPVLDTDIQNPASSHNITLKSCETSASQSNVCISCGIGNGNAIITEESLNWEKISPKIVLISTDNTSKKLELQPIDYNNLSCKEIDFQSDTDVQQSIHETKCQRVMFTVQGSRSSSTTSNKDPDSCPSSPANSVPSTPICNRKFLNVEDTPESVAHAHNLTFPDGHLGGSCNSPNKASTKENPCGLFSVDLSQMRSLRLFFCDKEHTCGQLVLASRESQYKILHFHNGGLDKLATVFEEWSFLCKSKTKDENCPYQFSVCRPEVSAAECHPEEGVYSLVDEVTWREFINEEGQIDDEFQLRKAIFFGGLDHHLRREVWPFLLHHYGFQTTFDERELIHNNRYIEYQAIRKIRENMSQEEKEQFWKNVQCTVEKDVVRTDRSNPFFAGDDNPNIQIMKNILLNYAVYNPYIGYTQGMSDLLAPVLAEVQEESETFWCFLGLMQRTIFFSSPKDSDMDTNLSYLQELLRLMNPEYHRYLTGVKDGLELLFAHRWILLCFKREFPEIEALRMWESCWAHYQTDYFHLFLCLAIVAIYGEDVMQQELRADEMLLHFSSLAMHMEGEMVLTKARGLLHQFRLLPTIPCTLAKLCELCGPGMWDSGHVPIVECIGHESEDSCPHTGQLIL